LYCFSTYNFYLKKIQNTTYQIYQSKDSEDSDNDDKVPIPIFRESFGDAIQTALETHMAKSKGIWSNILPNR
jgi:hypothetical protein